MLIRKEPGVTNCDTVFQWDTRTQWPSLQAQRANPQDHRRSLVLGKKRSDSATARSAGLSPAHLGPHSPPDPDQQRALSSDTARAWRTAPTANRERRCGARQNQTRQRGSPRLAARPAQLPQPFPNPLTPTRRLSGGVTGRPTSGRCAKQQVG